MRASLRNASILSQPSRLEHAPSVRRISTISFSAHYQSDSHTRLSASSNNPGKSRLLPPLRSRTASLATSSSSLRSYYSTSPKNMAETHSLPSRLGPGSTEVLTNTMEKPELDNRTYRVIRLPNKLEALLVHDPDTDKASAGMDVNIGSFSDSADLPGMAHAVEHLLFMGTEKVRGTVCPIRSSTDCSSILARMTTINTFRGLADIPTHSQHHATPTTTLSSLRLPHPPTVKYRLGRAKKPCRYQSHKHLSTEHSTGLHNSSSSHCSSKIRLTGSYRLWIRRTKRTCRVIIGGCIN